MGLLGLEQFLRAHELLKLTLFPREIGFHVGNKVRNASEELNVEVQQSLRLAMDKLASAVRNSNYGVPSGSLSSW